MRLSILAILALSVSLVCGCVSTTFKTPEGYEFNRVAVGYQAAFKSVKYGDFEVEGYDGSAQFDDFVKAWGALR